MRSVKVTQDINRADHNCPAQNRECPFNERVALIIILNMCDQRLERCYGYKGTGNVRRNMRKIISTPSEKSTKVIKWAASKNSFHIGADKIISWELNFSPSQLFQCNTRFNRALFQVSYMSNLVNVRSGLRLNNHCFQDLSLDKSKFEK